ncbi:MAG TPA: branched-chain amino acid transaminase [Thermomicrobiales bacterium]|nr:branched-chain amino acid transaminase [Thermomicrobiales bacterium]
MANFDVTMDYAFFEGKIVPFSKAKISIGTHALQYGTGAFGGIRGYISEDGKTINIVRLKEHTARLLRSAKLLRMDLPFTPDSLAEVVVELTKKNAPTTDTYFRPFVYKSTVSLSPKLQGLDDELAIYMLPMGDYLDTTRGQTAIVSSWTRSADNMIPSRGKFTGSYIGSAFAKDQAMAYGCDDAIMLNADGKVAEGSAANLFIVRDGTLITPPVTSDILEGITRRTIIELAGELGIPVEQRGIDRTELYIADEAFFCGTGVQVAWIEQIDGRTIGNGTQGAVAKQLYDTLFAIFRGKTSDHSDWITPVEIER